MPLALTLQANARALLAGSARLGAWNRLVSLEALLVARARSAFLVRWFGPRIPLAGSRLRIAIDNLPALRERYLALAEGTRSPRHAEGLDIVQPFANMLGTVASSFVNPLTLITILAAGAFQSFGRIAELLLSFLFGPLLPLILVFTGPFLLAPLLFSSPRELVEGYPLALAIGNLLPHLIELFEVLDRHFDAVVGNLFDLYVLFTSGSEPSQPFDLERARSVFAALVPLADSLAVFVPLLFLSLGWLLARVGPELASLEKVLPAFLRYVVSVARAIAAVFADLASGFETFVGSAKGGLRKVFSSLTLGGRFLKVLGGHFEGLFDAAKGLIDGERIAKAAEGWKKVLTEDLGKAIGKHPVVKFLDRLVTKIKAVLAQIGKIAKAAGRVIAGQAGNLVAGPLGKMLAEQLFDDLMKPSKEPSMMEKLLRFLKTAIPDAEAIRKRLPGPLTLQDAFPGRLFSEEPPKVPEALLERRLLLVRERKLLFTGGEMQAALDLRERRLRGFLFGVVGSLLPPKVGPYLEQLRAFLRQIDRALDREGPVSRFPVRAPEDPARLRPKVQKIRLAVRGRNDRDTVARWGQELREILIEQAYPAVPAASAVAGGA